MANWCNHTLEILEFQAGDPAKADAIQKDLLALSKKGFKPLRMSGQSGRSQMVLMRCGHHERGSVDQVIESHGCLVLYPLFYQGGWEEYRILALDEKRVEPLFRRLKKEGEVFITSKKPVEDEMLSRSLVLSTGELLAAMTDKQASSLLTAIEQGYYQVPRKTRTEDIARRSNVPRTTFEEHMRKAEGKIMRSIKPYLALWVGGSATSRGG